MSFCRKFRITELFTIKWKSAPNFCPNDNFSREFSIKYHHIGTNLKKCRFIAIWTSETRIRCPNRSRYHRFGSNLENYVFWHFFTVFRAWFPYKARNRPFTPYVTFLLFTQTYLHSQSGFKIFRKFVVLTFKTELLFRLWWRAILSKFRTQSWV